MTDPFADIRCGCGWVHYDFTPCGTSTAAEVVDELVSPIVEKLDETLDLLMGSR